MKPEANALHLNKDGGNARPPRLIMREDCPKMSKVQGADAIG